MSVVATLANTNNKYLMKIFPGLIVLTVEDSWRTTIHHWGSLWPSSSFPSASSSAVPWRRSSVSSATGVSPSQEERWKHILNHLHLLDCVPSLLSFHDTTVSQITSVLLWLPTTNLWYYWTCKSSEQPIWQQIIWCRIQGRIFAQWYLEYLLCRGS